MVSIADRGIVAIIITDRRIDDRPLKYVALEEEERVTFVST